MNRFSTRSTDKPQPLPLVYLLAAFWSTTSLACVSQPKPVSENAPAAAMSATAPVSGAPEAIAMFHGAPIAASVKTILAAPDVRQPVPASPLPSREPAIDITVLSASPVITFAPVRLPEPTAPAPTAAVKPSAPAPAAVSPPATPVAKPSPAGTASAAASPSAPTKPATTTPATQSPAVQPPAVAKAESGLATVLPASPASSARVEPASRPVAETKLETSRGERFELRFPGSGWIYLGDELGREGLRYETRRFEDNAAIFAMDPEQVGEYLLRFQRQNPVDRSTEVSLVRVTVAEKPASSKAPQASPPAGATAGSSPTSATPSPAVQSSAAGTTTSATPTSGAPAQTPSASPASPATPMATAATQAANQSAAQPNPSAGIDIQSITDPLELIKRARDELDVKRTQTALDALDRYLSLYPYGSDELYFLYGLAYEQDTPFRNIKKSYDSYRRVRDEYPRSARWKDAAERMAYLEKHYFGLR